MESIWLLGEDNSNAGSPTLKKFLWDSRNKAFLKISLQKFGNYRNLKKFKLLTYKTAYFFVDTIA